MSRYGCFISIFLLFGCAPGPKVVQKDIERENLIRKHNELFTYLGMSKPAVDELCGKVAWVYDGIRDHKLKNPEAHRVLEGITKRGTPQTHEEALQRHQNRFVMLGLFPQTQRELEAAFSSVHADLRTPNPSERALKIRDLMRQLPPCCDDAIFERAGASP